MLNILLKMQKKKNATKSKDAKMVKTKYGRLML